MQERLARGWNTWDVHSVATQVLLPDGLAIHVGMKHNTSLNGDAWLGDALIGRLDKGAEVVTPGPHAWDGSYTSADSEWKGHKWRVESAHDGDDLVMLVTPLEAPKDGALPPTVVFSVNHLWNLSGTVFREGDRIQAEPLVHVSPKPDGTAIFCTCAGGLSQRFPEYVDAPVSGDYFAADLTGPVGVSTGKRRTLEELEVAVARAKAAYEKSIADAGASGPILDAIETTLGWDTIYEPEKGRVISPVSRVWSVGWGGYVLFDWDTFFAATMAGMGTKDLAYANALEILREETPEGFVPNYARAGGWKSFDRSEPPVGAITVLGLYEKFHDRWFLEDAFEPLMKWNRWWAAHRDLDGYLTWGSDPENQPRNPDDGSVGKWQGAIYESRPRQQPDVRPDGLRRENASAGVRRCGADEPLRGRLRCAGGGGGGTGEDGGEREVKERGDKYRAKLQTMWDAQAGMFLNLNLKTGEKVTRLSPTNFYPMLAKAATPVQARIMVDKHLMNPREFWGEFVIPSIARDDPAFKDQDYWRGRIWGPMNYLVYLGLENYDVPSVRKDYADKSYALFLREWNEKRHVHENYNAVTGTGDDVTSSDRFYHWGALLGYLKAADSGQ